MGILSTGVPLYDLAIALVLGYFVAWYFGIRPLRRQLEEDGTHNFEADTELRTSNRSLDRTRTDLSSLQNKLAASEAALATTKEQLIKIQSDQDAAVEDKGRAVAAAENRVNTLTAELETRTNTVNDLQAQLAKVQEDAKNAAILAENNQQRARLAMLSAENEAMKYHITAKQLENQILRAQTGGIVIPSNITQDSGTQDNSWLHNNMGANATPSYAPQYAQHSGEQDHHSPTAG